VGTIPDVDEAQLRAMLDGPDGLAMVAGYMNDLIRDTNRAEMIALAAARGFMANEGELAALHLRCADLLAANTQEVERKRLTQQHCRALLDALPAAFHTREFADAAHEAEQFLGLSPTQPGVSGKGVAADG
jgi:hypothetical protein